MEEQVKKEIVELTELASPTFAEKLGVSYETGLYILTMLDNLPEIRKYHKTLRKLTELTELTEQCEHQGEIKRGVCLDCGKEI